MSERLVTIRRYEHPLQGELQRLLLEQAGIRVLMNNAEVVSQHWGLGIAVGYVQMQVPEALAAKAMQILSEFDSETAAILERHTEEADGQPEPTPKCISCGSKMLEDADTCANCGWSFNEVEAELVTKSNGCPNCGEVLKSNRDECSKCDWISDARQARTPEEAALAKRIAFYMFVSVFTIVLLAVGVISFNFIVNTKTIIKQQKGFHKPVPVHHDD